MSVARTILSLAVRGAVLGALLAAVAPESRISAGEEGCKCDDSGSGGYSCSYDQTACLGGAERCRLECISS
ncbi:MAG: hypothetical protein K2Y23_02390 [Cyanobacteria bacterium]|nr:hypothetical protein [Cyanobacteriota bacterium]